MLKRLARSCVVLNYLLVAHAKKQDFNFALVEVADEARRLLALRIDLQRLLSVEPRGLRPTIIKRRLRVLQEKIDNLCAGLILDVGVARIELGGHARQPQRLVRLISVERCLCIQRESMRHERACARRFGNVG